MARRAGSCLDLATEAVELAPAPPSSATALGYERVQASLRGGGRYSALAHFYDGAVVLRLAHRTTPAFDLLGWIMRRTNAVTVGPHA